MPEVVRFGERKKNETTKEHLERLVHEWAHAYRNAKEVKDDHYYIFEAAVEMVLGEDCWDKLNKANSQAEDVGIAKKWMWML